MRRALLFLALCTVVGCGVLLGIEAGNPERDVDDSSTGTETGGPGDGSNDAVIADSNGGDAPVLDSGLTGIPCLGVQLDAFFCDGFEEPALNPAWQPILTPDAATFKPVTTYKAKGLNGGLARFLPIPDNGNARIAWKRPGGGGPMAFQFALYVMSDAWSVGQDVPVGAFRGGANLIRVYFVPNGNDANGELQVRFDIGSTVTPINLGASKLNAWQCIELVHDGMTLTAYVGSTNQGTRPVPDVLDTAEIGFDWPYTGNAGAAKSFAYDNVAIGPARLGCIAN